ncbi:MAG: S8 family serine peptidase [bacterium]|nr:S8 family serine peptidase [bacterium]
MKKQILSIFLFFLLLLVCTNIIFAAENTSYQKGVLIVKFKEDSSLVSPMSVGSSKPRIDKLLDKHTAKIEKFKIKSKKQLFSQANFSKMNKNPSTGTLATSARTEAFYKHGLERIYKVEFDDSQDPLALAQILKDELDIEYITPAPVFKPLATVPNDPKFNDQWYLSASFSGDINIKKAWDLTTGAANVVVAVIDTAFRTSHEDLESNFDLTSDYDFADHDSNVFPDNIVYQEHGTQVASALGAVGNNAKGIAGAAWNVKLMPLKCAEAGDPEAWLINTGEAIMHAVDNGAKIINMSFGAYESAWELYIADTCAYAYASGVTLVAASGNANESPIAYPARLDTVIAVSATGVGNVKTDFSDYGLNVDVSAPGINISVADSGTDEDYYSTALGTSFSAPLVSGVCALMLSVNSSLTPLEIETILEDNAVLVSDYGMGSGVVDAYESVKAAILMNEPMNIEIDSTNFSFDSGLQASWDRPTGISSNCEYFYQLATRDDDSFELLTSSWESLGTTTSCFITGLSFSENMDVYILIKAKDAEGNESVMISRESSTYILVPAYVKIDEEDEASLLVPNSTTSVHLKISLTQPEITTIPILEYSFPFESSRQVLTLTNRGNNEFQGDLFVPADTSSGFIKFYLDDLTYTMIDSSSTLSVIASSHHNLLPVGESLTTDFVEVAEGIFDEKVMVLVTDATVGKDFRILDHNNEEITSFSGGIKIKVPYEDVSITGISEDGLDLYYLNGDVWQKVDAIRDEENDIFSATVTHFSVYAVLQTLANLKDVIVYPNPCYFADFQVLKIEGIPLDVSDVLVKIYDISGRLIRELDDTELEANTGGANFVWDGRDKLGNEVASGVYLFLIQSSQDKRIEKVAILW